jgi:hypothetical protein
VYGVCKHAYLKMIQSVKRNKCSVHLFLLTPSIIFYIEGGKRNKCSGNLFLFPPSIIFRFQMPNFSLHVSVCPRVRSASFSLHVSVYLRALCSVADSPHYRHHLHLVVPNLAATFVSPHQSRITCASPHQSCATIVMTFSSSHMAHGDSKSKTRIVASHQIGRPTACVALTIQKKKTITQGGVESEISLSLHMSNKKIVLHTRQSYAGRNIRRERPPTATCLNEHLHACRNYAIRKVGAERSHDNPYTSKKDVAHIKVT